MRFANFPLCLQASISQFSKTRTSLTEFNWAEEQNSNLSHSFFFDFDCLPLGRSSYERTRSSLATMKEDVLEFGDGAAFTGKFNLGKVSMLMQV